MVKSGVKGLMVGTVAEKTIIVTEEMTIGHFVRGMPQVYSTPIMILHMEMAAGAAIDADLPEGHVSVGMEVNVRHLAATPVGRAVRVAARMIGVEGTRVLFAVEAWNDKRKIGDGTHRRGIVDLSEFEERFGVKKAITD